MSRRTLALAALVAALIAAAVVVVVVVRGGGDSEPVRPRPTPRGTPLAYPGEIIGVVGNSLDAGAGIQDAIKRLGATWIREEVRWSEVERRRGHADFHRYDTLFTRAAQRGLHVLPLLIEVPRWESPEPLRLPADLGAWSRFVSATVMRYKPGGSFWRAHPRLDARAAPRVWEAWNEPYFKSFDDRGPRPAAYARLAAATADAVHAADPTARTLAAAETAYRTRSGAIRNWTRDVLAAAPDLPRRLGGLAVHPYTPGDPLATADVPPGRRFDRIDGVSRAVGGRLPLWITEIGWSTCTSSECVSRSDQAGDFARLLTDVATRRRRMVAAIFAYRITDLGNSPASDLQSGFGLVDLRGRRKPAYGVLARAAAQAGG